MKVQGKELEDKFLEGTRGMFQNRVELFNMNTEFLIFFSHFFFLFWGRGARYADPIRLLIHLRR